MKSPLIIKDAFQHDVKVSRIMFGGSGLSFMNGGLSDEFLGEMIARGLFTFDMARMYGNGRAEELLGAFLKRNQIPREQVTIVSKCCHPAMAVLSRVHPGCACRDIEATLKALNVSYVDCYLLHRDDPLADPRKVITFMNELVKKGQVRSIGVSNWKSDRIKMANDYALSHHMVPFVVSEPQFSPGERVRDPWHNGTVTITGEKNERERQFLKENHMAAFCFSSLGDGFFSGKFKSDDLDLKKKLTSWSKSAYYSAHNLEVLKRLELMAQKKEVSVATLSLAYCLNQDFDACCITSVSNMKRVEENLSSINMKLDKEELNYLSLK